MEKQLRIHTMLPDLHHQYSQASTKEMESHQCFQSVPNKILELQHLIRLVAAD
jgi:hypothetical protein